MSKRVQIDLIKKKPIKIYKIIVRNDNHFDELCKFLKNNKDKQLQVIINGKTLKFNSLVDKKRFVTGLECATKVLTPLTKHLFENLQAQINKLKKENSILNTRLDIQNGIVKRRTDKMRMLDSLMSLRQEAYKDRVDELVSSLDILTNELEDK